MQLRATHSSSFICLQRTSRPRQSLTYQVQLDRTIPYRRTSPRVLEMPTTPLTNITPLIPLPPSNPTSSTNTH